MNLEQVERLAVARDVLGRHDRALDDEQVELAGDDGREQLVVRCGVTDAAATTPGLADLADPRCRPARGRSAPRRSPASDGWPSRRRARRSPRGRSRGPRSGSRGPRGCSTPRPPRRPISMAVAGETTPSMAEARSGSSKRKRVDLPGDVDVLGVARAAARHDGDVVEAVGPASGLAQPDLDVSHVQPSPSASPVGIDRTEGPTVAPMIRRLLAAVLLTLAVAGVPAVARAPTTRPPRRCPSTSGTTP